MFISVSWRIEMSVVAAKVYDDKQITAYAYDFNGKNALTA